MAHAGVGVGAAGALGRVVLKMGRHSDGLEPLLLGWSQFVAEVGVDVGADGDGF